MGNSQRCKYTGTMSHSALFLVFYPAHLSHGHLVHILGVFGPFGQKSISLQGLQGFDGDRGTVVGFQGVWSGSVGLQQEDDVFSGLVRGNTHLHVCCVSKKVLQVRPAQRPSSPDSRVKVITSVLSVNSKVQNWVFTTRWRHSLTSKSWTGLCFDLVSSRGVLAVVPACYLDFSFHDSQEVQQVLPGQRSTHVFFLVLLLLRSFDPLLHELWRALLALSDEPLGGLVVSFIWTFHGAVSGAHFLSSVETDQRN